jgi:DnaA-homolog protein
VKQLALDFSPAPLPTLDNFVVGRNAELVHRLRGIGSAPRDDRSIYIWGASGSGRSHLLRAVLTQLQGAGARMSYLDCALDTRLSVLADELDVVALDNVERLGESGQIALFNLYNAFRESGKTLLAAGNAPPMKLALRADVTTRLGWGAVYEVHVLTDAEKADALAEHAAARGFTLQPDVGRYLLTHVERDMPALLGILDALDRYSLEARRAVTVPLVRELLSVAPADK